MLANTLVTAFEAVVFGECLSSIWALQFDNSQRSWPKVSLLGCEALQKPEHASSGCGVPSDEVSAGVRISQSHDFP